MRIIYYSYETRKVIYSCSYCILRISAQKQPSCDKGAALKSLGEKSCEKQKGGGQQMATVMLILTMHSHY